jgi:hypothetical protein
MRISALASALLISGLLAPVAVATAGNEERVPASLSFFFARAAAGESGAQLLLGEMLLQSGYRREALPWLIKAANRGNREAQYRLGVMHDTGLGTVRDEAQAAHWLTLASRQGEPQASARLLLREVTTIQMP